MMIALAVALAAYAAVAAKMALDDRQDLHKFLEQRRANDLEWEQRAQFKVRRLGPVLNW